jgi:hypothetical protein
MKLPSIKTTGTAVGGLGLPLAIGNAGLAFGGGAIALGALPLAIVGGCVGYTAASIIKHYKDQ